MPLANWVLVSHVSNTIVVGCHQVENKTFDNLCVSRFKWPIGCWLHVSNTIVVGRHQVEGKTSNNLSVSRFKSQYNNNSIFL